VGGIFAGMEASTVSVAPRLVLYTHVMYGLQAAAVLVGLLTALSIAGRFVFGYPSLIAVVMNFARRPAARGTWLESHFHWQWHTFWPAAVLIICLSPLAFTIVLIGFVKWLFIAVGIWTTYRVARGWFTLRQGRPMPAGFP
jgi:uncharacterized membrane protein